MAFVTSDQCVGQRCSVTADFLVNTRKRNKMKEGAIVGCYYNDYWHPYTYRAFHIQFDDGTKGTFIAKDVKIKWRK